MTFNPKAKGIRGSSFAAAIVRLHGVSPTAKNTAILIYEYVNTKRGVAWPSEARIARELDVRRDTVSRHIKELLNKGVLVVKPCRNGGGRFASNAYAFLWRPEYAATLLPGAVPVKVDESSICTPSASAVTVLEKSDTNEVDSVDRSKTDSKQSRAQAASAIPRPPEPASERAGAGPDNPNQISHRPTDEEVTGEVDEPSGAGRVDPTLPSDWTPTPEDGAKLLAFMQEKTGGGDFEYAMGCLRRVRRGATCIDDVLAVLRLKVRGRPRNNGYIRAVIDDQFGELPEQTAMRETRARAAIDQRISLAAEYDELRQTASANGDIATWEKLTQLGKQGWIREQEQVSTRAA